MASHEKHDDDIEKIDLVDDSGEITELAVVAEGEERTTWFVWILVSCSTISGLLFGMFPAPPSPPPLICIPAGYDTGVISGALVTIGSDLGPPLLSDGQKACISMVSHDHAIDTFCQEFITSATTLGALLGGLVAGVISDWTGRRPVLGIADIIFIGGAVAQAACHDVWSMVGYILLLEESITYSPTDRRKVLDRDRRRPRILRRPLVYPRTFSHTTSRAYGRPQVRLHVLKFTFISTQKFPAV